MRKKIFSVRDGKGEFYANPFYKGSHGEAERDFGLAINDPQSGLLNSNPEDFDLYYLGEFDPQSGKVFPVETPQHIVKGVNLKKNQTGPQVV